MTKYKTFNEVKRGDTLYGIDISNISCQFKKYKVLSYDDNLSSNEVLEMYIDESPLSFDFKRNESQWHQMIFTTREEAIESAKNQIVNKMLEFTDKVDDLALILGGIDDIEFKQD